MTLTALHSTPAFAAGAAPLVTAHSATVDVVGAPCSVVPHTLEDDQLIRFYALYAGRFLLTLC